MRALALSGPTASGKSDFAAAVAECINGEIISVDSGAVYRDMNIGTAKPSAAAQQQTPHHLINIRAPNESFNVGMFYRLAIDAAREISSRGKTPLFVGGTMMYFHALLNGLHDLPSSADVRHNVQKNMQQWGAAIMHKQLAAADAATAAKISPSDSQRIARALEIMEVAKQPVSAMMDKQKMPPPLSLSFIVLMPSDRARLRQSIGVRLQEMFAAGLVLETHTVLEKYRVSVESSPMRMAGYRQAAAFLRGNYDESEMRRRAYFATCQLSKRQMTWLKKWQTPLATIDPFAANAADKIMFAVRQFGNNGE